MDEHLKKIKEVQRIERGINRNLFLICSVVTIVTMALMATNFFTRGEFLPTKIGFFYLSVVLIYSLHKEFVRWLGDKEGKRNGEYFVYAWMLLTTALYVINFFSNDYFSYSSGGFQVSTLADVAFTTIEILAIFVVTRSLKIFFMFRKP